jgi:hypothetical protein
VAAILILILGRGHMQQFFVVGQIALWVATVAAIVSAVDYSRRINGLVAPAPRPAEQPPAPRPAERPAPAPPAGVRAASGADRRRISA